MRKWIVGILSRMADRVEKSTISDKDIRIGQLQHQILIREQEIHSLKVRCDMLEAVTELNLKMLDKMAAVHGRESAG